jgi:hypothetical protein
MPKKMIDVKASRPLVSSHASNDARAAQQVMIKAASSGAKQCSNVEARCRVTLPYHLGRVRTPLNVKLSGGRL